MKKLILSIVAAGIATLSMAQDDYKYLTIATSSAESSIELATIQKITFDMNEKLVVVTTSEGEVKFAQSEMQKMFFTDAPTAIKTLPIESSDLKMKGNTLQAQGNGLLRIYNAAGQLLQMANVEGDANINLGKLPSGVYIINLGKQTIKVSK